MTTVRAAGIILAKELRLEFRTRELLAATIIFALVVLVLFSFAFEPTAAESRRYGPGLLWIAFLFAGSLMLNPSFAREQNNETLDALRMAPISSFAILLGKILANFIFMSLAERGSGSSLRCPLQCFSGRHRLERLILVLVLGTLGLTITGTVFSAISAHARMRELLAPVAVAPASDSAPDRGGRIHGLAVRRATCARPHLARLSRRI